MTVGVTHHIELNGHEYLVKPFSYSKKSAPQFGARFSTGDPDFNNLSFWQHWAQNCFIGGMDAEEWADDAMYDDGVGISTEHHQRVTLARDLRRGGGSNWAAGSGANHKAWKFIVYNNILYAVTIPVATNAATLWQYVPASDGWTQITAFTGVNARSIATYAGKLFIGGMNLANSAPILKYSSGALGTWTTVTNPSGIASTQPVSAMRAFQQKLYVAWGVNIWRMKDDLTWDGNVVFYKASASSESNNIESMEVHLGFLYMLSRNGHIHRSDGNSTFDIWSWDGQTQGVAIKSFDGRLFVATNEYSDPAAPTEAFGVLYQMSGSAVTQLKRWGKLGEYTGLGSLTVFDRRLFYGASNLLGQARGFGVAAYDPIEDAHSIMASNVDTVTYAPGSAPYLNYAVTDVIAFGNRIYSAVAGFGLFYTRYSFKDYKRLVADYDVSAAGASVGPQNGGWFTTSTYDAGTPGMNKLWRRISIDYELPSTPLAIVVEYSTDAGGSWTTCLSLNPGVAHTRRLKDIWLENVKSTSLKLRFTLRSANSIYTPVFYGFVVSYLPMPEPNWMWTFTIPLSELQQGLDGVSRAVDTEAEIAFLSLAWRNKQLVTYTDMDGVRFSSSGSPGVLIYDIDVRMGVGTQPLEADVVVQLLEAVETY